MEPKFNCEKCQYNCKYLSEWNEHILCKKHTGEKRKPRSDKTLDEKCKFCEYKPTKTTNLQLHYLNKHATKEELGSNIIVINVILVVLLVFYTRDI